MSWPQFARATNPKTCLSCEHFYDIGGCTKYVAPTSAMGAEYLKFEIAKQKCVYEKKQAKYPEQYPNPYKPYGWLAKFARKEENKCVLS